MMKKCPVQNCGKKDVGMNHLHDDHTREELAITACLLISKWDLAAKVIRISDLL